MRKRKTKAAPQPPADPVTAPHTYRYTQRNAEEDRLLTAILRIGEALASPYCRNETGRPPALHASPEKGEAAAIPGDMDRLLGVLAEIRALATQDTPLAELLSGLPAAFGDGNALRSLFRTLFPGQKPAKVLDSEGKAILSEREAEVLLHAAGDRSQEDIAQRLGISRLTVRQHFDNIYRKLGVHRPMQAVMRAMSLGYLEMDAMQWLLYSERTHASGGDEFSSFCATVTAASLPMPLADMEPLASFGLLLLLVSGAAARQMDGDSQPSSWGGICEVNARGEVIRCFGAEGMGIARSIALAPPHAAREGFTPGNLFVAHDYKPQHGLNRAAITEFTPEGRFVRTFCGSREIGGRIVGPLGLAFAADGRMLATSGWLTNAILAFSEGGATVERFADGHYTQVCVAESGSVYAVQHDIQGSVIQVFSADGGLLQTLSPSPSRMNYEGIAVNGRGHIFVLCNEDGVLQVEDGRNVIMASGANGEWLRSFEVPGLHIGRLALDAQERLYLPYHRDAVLQIFAPDGTRRKRIDLNGALYPHAVAMGDEDTIWLCGRLH